MIASSINNPFFLPSIVSLWKLGKAGEYNTTLLPLSFCLVLRNGRPAVYTAFQPSSQRSSAWLPSKLRVSNQATSSGLAAHPALLHCFCVLLQSDSHWACIILSFWFYIFEPDVFSPMAARFCHRLSTVPKLALDWGPLQEKTDWKTPPLLQEMEG